MSFNAQSAMIFDEIWLTEVFEITICQIRKYI